MPIIRSTDHIASLDLCRGLAAISVLLFHTGFLFRSEGSTLVPRAYLCVDFFFLLSGYVVASSYDKKLAVDMTFLDFAGVRLARLWPLIALSTLLGFLFQGLRIARDGQLDVISALISLILNVLILPSPMGPTAAAFPFNPSSWSLFFEIAVNLLYAALFLRLDIGRMVALVVGGFCGLILVVALFNTLDVGWSASNFIFGTPRVVFSFFVGVAFFRLRDFLPQATLSGRTLAGGLAVAFLTISCPTDASWFWNGWIDLAITILVFPLLFWVALVTKMTVFQEKVSIALGGISYSVYLLQTPLMFAFSGVPQLLFARKISEFAPWGGFVFFVAMLIVSYATWQLFERPCQRFLRRILTRN